MLAHVIYPRSSDIMPERFYTLSHLRACLSSLFSSIYYNCFVVLCVSYTTIYPFLLFKDRLFKLCNCCKRKRMQPFLVEILSRSKQRISSRVHSSSLHIVQTAHVSSQSCLYFEHGSTPHCPCTEPSRDFPACLFP